METWRLPLSYVKDQGENKSHRNPSEQYKKVAYLLPADTHRTRNSFSRGSSSATLDYADSSEHLDFEHSWAKVPTSFLGADNPKTLLAIPSSFDNILWIQDFFNQEIDNTSYKAPEEREEYREEWSNEYFTSVANKCRQKDSLRSEPTSYPETLTVAHFDFWDSLEYQGHTSRSVWSWEAIFTNRIPRSTLSCDQLTKTVHNRIDLLLNHLATDKAES